MSDIEVVARRAAEKIVAESKRQPWQLNDFAWENEIVAIITTELSSLPIPNADNSWQAAIDAVDSIENDNDLNDGGFFEAGFIAAKTRILDALIEHRNSSSLPSERESPRDAAIAHFCSQRQRWIPYPSLLCSMCHDAVDRNITTPQLCDTINAYQEQDALLAVERARDSALEEAAQIADDYTCICGDNNPLPFDDHFEVCPKSIAAAIRARIGEKEEENAHNG